MKKILSLVLVVACFVGVVGMTACNKNDDNNTTTTTTPELTTPESTTPPVTVELSVIHEAVKAAYGEMYFPNMPLDPEYIASMKSISADLYSEYIVEIPMISANADEFMAFKAAEGKADQLETALNAYKDYLINESFQYPTNKVRVQASEVIRHGDYMFFVLLGGGISIETEGLGEDAMLKEAEEQVQIGVDVINGFFN